MKNWLKNYRWHIIAWATFILYEYILISLILKINATLLSYCIHYIINITLFYIHAELVLGKSLKSNRPIYLRIIILTIVEVCLYTIIAYLTDRSLSKTTIVPIDKLTVTDWKFMSSTLWRGIYFMLFSTAYYFIKSYIHQKHRATKLEKEAIEEMLKQKQITLELANAKNAYLKAQINPHFLFNTLTYIYNSTHKSEPRAAEAVRYLSKLMRYALECEHGPEIMPLEAEIRQVENLLQLSRIKQPDLFIDFSYDQKIESTEIIPLLLLSLTENMVKHGNLSQPEDPGKIMVKLYGGQFSIQTSNLINTGLNDTGFHTGLENIRQRLLHTYADRAEISSGMKDNYFEVLITINLEEAHKFI
ncbi:two-component system LytT family sensor kinase [Pedobacter sp. W3I1]|uniref:sensor histidine kinase n=1 Tax=Pedobacter sp. W3I1 TaxID=3042291 RepID=UPI00277E2EAF|nr:sensor histidine kinase [Pedobacter sp. W3I1]MDQ0638672.1 two-component system LytT family sensor kinase [Pedobacter sp. W3I1]